MAKKNHPKRPGAPAPRAAKPTFSALDNATPFGWKNRRDWADLGIVVGVALVLRLAFFYLNQKFNPTFRFPIMDSLYHHEWAMDLVKGGTKGTDAFFRGPLYPYFLALLYKLSGNSIAFAIFVQHLIGSLTAGLIYLTARDLFSRRVALVAGITTALYWVLVYMEGDLLLETTFIFLNTLSMYLLLRAMKTNKVSLFAAGGFALGLATIDRPSVMVFFIAVPVAVYLAARQRGASAKSWITRLVVTAVACAIPIAPVMIRNYVVAKAIVPVGASGGVNFWIGNNPNSDGSTAIVPGTRADWWGGYFDAIAIAEKDAGHKLNLAQVSDYYFAKGKQFIREHPDEAWPLMWKKFRMYWGAGERANDKYIYFFWHLAKMKWVPLPGFWLVGPLAFLGGVLLWRRRSELAMFYLFIIVYSLGVIAFFVNARFRLPIMPAMTLFSAYACVYIVDAYRKKSLDLVKALLILAPAALFVNSDYLYQKQMRAYSDAFSNYTLGNAYLKMGLKGTALAHYTRADEISQAYPTPAYNLIKRDVDYNLGTLLWEQGMCSRAVDVLARVGGADDEAMHALDCMGDCFLQRKDLQNARQVYQQMSQISPRDERSITGLARVTALSGDNATAEKMLKEIVDPTHTVYAPAYVALAQVQRDQNKLDDAIQSYTNIATMDGYERTGYLALAEIYRQKGDYPHAIAAARQAQMHSSPGDTDVSNLLQMLQMHR
ncbi:MAG TPA: glycosyltransferase family 39 protein [Candidatus Krumholzibacteria bacterium]|nr:glycosyltransferase family 39 protein [Candidatus Krumholzibacteria bacterium]